MNLKSSVSRIPIVGASVLSARHLRRIRDILTDIKSGGRYERYEYKSVTCNNWKKIKSNIERDIEKYKKVMDFKI